VPVEEERQSEISPYGFGSISYPNSHDQEIYRAPFVNFLENEQRLVILNGLFQKLMNLYHQNSSNQDLGAIGKLVSKSLGFPLPFDLEKVVNEIGNTSNCFLNVGLELNSFHARVQKISDQCLDDVSKFLVIFLNMNWYNFQNASVAADLAHTSPVAADSAPTSPVAGPSGVGPVAVDSAPASPVAGPSGRGTFDSMMDEPLFESAGPSGVGTFDSILDEPMLPSVISTTPSRAPSPIPVSTTVDATKAKIIVDADTRMFFIAIQILCLRIAGFGISLCRFASEEVKEAMDLIELPSNDTPVNRWKIRDPSLANILDAQTAVVFSSHTGSLMSHFGYIFKVIEGKVNRLSNINISTYFKSKTPDSFCLDILPRVLFEELYVLGLFYFDADPILITEYGEKAFSLIRTNALETNLHLLLKDDSSFDGMARSILSKFGTEDIGISRGKIKYALCPYLSSDVVQQYKKIIQSKESQDVNRHLQQPVYFERQCHRNKNPFIEVMDLDWTSDFRDAYLTSEMVLKSETVLKTIRSRLMRNAVTLQKGRNGEIINEVKLALNPVGHFKVLIFAFGTKDAPAINPENKTLSFQTLKIGLCLVKIGQDSTPQKLNIQSILLLSGMVEGSKTTSLNQQSMLHQFLYRQYLIPGRVFLYDPASFKLAAVMDNKLYSLILERSRTLVSTHEMKTWPKLTSIYKAQNLVSTLESYVVSVDFPDQKKNLLGLSTTLLGFSCQSLEDSCLQSLATYNQLKSWKKAYNLKKDSLDSVKILFNRTGSVSEGTIQILGKLTLQNDDLIFNVAKWTSSSEYEFIRSWKLSLWDFYDQLGLTTISISDFTKKFYELNKGRQSELKNYTLGLKNGQLAIRNFRHLSVDDFKEDSVRVRSLNKFDLLFDKSTVDGTILPSEMLQMRSLLRKANKVDGFGFNAKSSYVPDIKIPLLVASTQQLDTLMDLSRSIKNAAITHTIHAHLFGQMISFAAQQALSFDSTVSSRLSCSFVDEKSLKLAFEIFDMNGQKRESGSIQDSEIVSEMGNLMMYHARSNGIWDLDRLTAVLSLVVKVLNGLVPQDMVQFIDLLKSKSESSSRLLAFFSLLIQLCDETMSSSLNPANQDFQNVEADQVNGIYLELNSGQIYGFSSKEVSLSQSTND